MEKLISSAKSLFGSHMGMMILCCLVMVGALWGISGIELGGGGGALLFLIPLAVCLGMHFVMHRFMGHGGHKHPQEENQQASQETPGTKRNIGKPGRLEPTRP